MHHTPRSVNGTSILVPDGLGLSAAFHSPMSCVFLESAAAVTQFQKNVAQKSIQLGRTSGNQGAKLLPRFRISSCRFWSFQSSHSSVVVACGFPLRPRNSWIATSIGSNLAPYSVHSMLCHGLPIRLMVPSSITYLPRLMVRSIEFCSPVAVLDAYRVPRNH